MALTAALFVSKRLQVATAAILCLTAIQLLIASCTTEPVSYPAAVRVAVTR
jgi:hypothetical protein